MVIFDQLRLSDDAQKMYVNVHVNTASYFDNIYLDRIVVMTSDKVLEATTTDLYPTDSESNPIGYEYTKQFEDGVKEAALVLTVNDFQSLKTTDMSNTLFFVYVKCKGTVGECTPCRLDELTTLGVTFDEKMLYQRVMGYAKELADDCKVPIRFADFILLWNAFKAAVETEHYVAAIKYWEMLFDKSQSTALAYTTKECGCHG